MDDPKNEAGIKVDNPFIVNVDATTDKNPSGTNGTTKIVNENPFETNYDEETEGKDIYKEDSETVKQPKEFNEGKDGPYIDPNMPYFFVFGNSTAGKSAMLAKLIYHMKTAGIGQLRSLSFNDDNHSNQKKGDFILRKMTKKVRKGEFIEGTPNLDKLDFVFPTEINLQFEPNNIDVPMPFCLLEMAGEDLKEIELRDEGNKGGKFDERINYYLMHPDCSIIFICVVDIDEPYDSEDLIDEFLTYLDKIGHRNNPILVTINKWDKIADKYSNSRQYIAEELPIIENLLQNKNRNMANMSFSVGKVYTRDNMDVYDAKDEEAKKYPETLLKWMYEVATGISLDEEEEAGAKRRSRKSLLHSFKRIFSNG